MDYKLIEREQIIVGGISVETQYENNNKDRKRLFDDFRGEKMELLSKYAKNPNEFYCATWLTGVGENFFYLLSQEIADEASGFETQTIPAGLYACAKFPKNNNDTLQAWIDFYEKIDADKSKTGYRATGADSAYPHFERYPNGLDGDYELWISLEKDV